PDQIDGLVDYGPDEVLRKYRAKECPWVLSDALTPEIGRLVRASKAPDWKPPKAALPTVTQLGGVDRLRDVSPDAYDVPSGRTYVLRFRCAPPLDVKEARLGLAALLDRAALAANAP